MPHNLWLLFRPEGDGSDGGGGTGSEGSGGSGSGSQEDKGGTGSSQAGGSSSTSEAERKVQEANREAANYRHQLREAEKRLEDLEKAQLTDQEKVLKERDKLQEKTTTLEQTNRDLRVQVIAQRVGIGDPEAASKLLDWGSIKDDTDSTQIEDGLKKLLADKPYLAGQVAGGSDGGAGTGSGAQAQDMNQMIRSAAGRG